MSTTSDHGTAVTTTEEVPDVAHDERATTPRTGNGVFRAFWRWHFYASVLVIPIMAMLALTGGLLSYRYGRTPGGMRELLRAMPKPNFWHAPTANEAQYLIGFKTADEIRNRRTKATQEIHRRLRSKGIELAAGDDG